MLQLRPNCECCDRDLPPASDEAVICSFECTFGELVARPRRPAAKLKKFPASQERVLRPDGCRKAA
jgi:uncharacterized protein